MGQSCFKPKRMLKKRAGNTPILETNIKDPNIISYVYKEILTKVNDEIFKNYLNVTSNDNLIAKTKTKRPISKNSVDDIPSKVTCCQTMQVELKEIRFFTDYYTIDDLEEFLSNCSSNYSPRTLDESEDDDLPKSLLGMDIENLSDEEVKTLLKNNKIHLTLAEKPKHVSKLIILLRKATHSKIIGEVLDLTNDDQNSAISIAALNSNIQAFYYLLMTYQAYIPLYIHNQEGRRPFLVYIAQNGKIKTNKENEKLEYIPLLVLKQLIHCHQRDYLLKHLNVIDPKTNLSFPHFLLNIYSKTIDIGTQVIECLKLCVKESPECVDVMCVNYYDPRFSYNVTANFISHPNIDVEIIAEFMEPLNKSLQNNDKILLRELIRVHPDNKRKAKLLQIIS